MRCRCTRASLSSRGEGGNGAIGGNVDGMGGGGGDGDTRL